MNSKKWKTVSGFVFICVMTLFFLPGIVTHAAEPESVVVFAAASTTNAVTEIAERFNRMTAAMVVPTFAASSTLAKQIQDSLPLGRLSGTKVPGNNSY